MKTYIRKYIILLILPFTAGFSSCNSYLDVVPEGVSRLENAFSMRSEAIRYLYTCYSYMFRDGQVDSDPAIWGDEMWTLENAPSYQFGYGAFDIARGLQNSNSPLINRWDHFYVALRDCNIFLENIGTVPDLPSWECDQWIAEVKFLKAYYHFCLVRMYGPISLIKTNLPINATEEQTRVPRDPVDDCFAYIVELLDEIKDELPLRILNPSEEMGRITKPIAYALKAKVLVFAASPLFNGNTEQAALKNRDGTQLFDQTVQVEKWDAAVEACKEAIDVCVDEIGMRLYTYPGNTQFSLSDEIKTQLTLRNSFTEKWNSEIIWGNTQSTASFIQQATTPKLNSAFLDSENLRNSLGTSIKIVETFYTANGVPLNEDKTIAYDARYDLRTSTGSPEEKYYIRNGYTTINMHYDREPRFYAWVGFDGGIWYGQSKYDDSNPSDLFYVQNRKGMLNGKAASEQGPATGYYPKKYVHFENVHTALTTYSTIRYPWPMIRLSDLFLLYAEALNESGDAADKRAEAIKWIDRVRERAGLKGVEESWSNYSTNANKYTTQTGLRQIIQQERMIELSFEGQRFWDIRRWKTAPALYRTPFQGWDLEQGSPEYYYRPRIIAQQTFGLKDYFWPISDSQVTVNKELVQNLGW